PARAFNVPRIDFFRTFDPDLGFVEVYAGVHDRAGPALAGLAVANIYDGRFSANRRTQRSAVAASRSLHMPLLAQGPTAAHSSRQGRWLDRSHTTINPVSGYEHPPPKQPKLVRTPQVRCAASCAFYPKSEEPAARLFISRGGISLRAQR